MRGRVEAQVGVVAVQARSQPLEAACIVGSLSDCSESSFGRAVERIGLAGAALIDEDDVAVGLDAAEQLRERRGHLRGALARAAGEEEQRIGLRVAAERRQHDDLQVDRAALARLAVLEDRQRAAVGVGRPFVTSCRDAAGRGRRAPDAARSRVAHSSRRREATERSQSPTSYIRPRSPARSACCRAHRRSARTSSASTRFCSC